MLRLVSSTVRVVALVVLAFFYALGLPLALVESGRRVMAGIRAPDLAGIRRAELGDDTVARFDAIRQRIPPHDAYLLTGRGAGAAGLFRVRYELAPRRPILADSTTTESRGAVRWLVVAHATPLAPDLVDLAAGEAPPR